MPLSIDQIPIPVPSSTDPANFSARGDAVFGAFPNFITQTNAVASEQANNRDLAEASKIAAAISETNAATYAANATTSSNNANTSSVAALWVSGTTYAINDKRVSPITGQVYRRKTAGAGTTDPSLDSTNWYAVLLDADTQYPSIKPTLNLDFANSGKLDPRITFTRASTATYYDGKTFAKADENLLLRSQEFDNSTWVKSAATIGANAAASPNGSTTADKLVPDTSATTHLVSSTVQVINGETYTFSVYLKAAEYGAALVGFIGGGGFSTTSAAIVDLATGSISTGVGSLLSMSSTNAGSGYWRISVSLATSASGSGQVYVAAINGSTYADRLNAGNGSSGIYLWGAQLEQRSQVTAYTPTTDQPITKYQPVLRTASNNEPRFDYDPITLEAKGLLIEESRQNLLTYSEQFDNAAWVKSGATITANTVIAPDGTLTGDKLIADTTASALHRIQVQPTTATATAYALSVYAKAGEQGFVAIRDVSLGISVWFNLTTGAVATVNPGIAGVITSVGNGWYRCVALRTTATANTLWAISGSSADAVITYTGNGFSGIYIWGAQLEAGAFPTSYIPTTTAQATRAADAAVMTGTNFSSWYRQDEGTVYIEHSKEYAGTSISYAITDGTFTNLTQLLLYPTETRFGAFAGGAAIIDLVSPSTYPQVLRSAFAVKSGDSARALNNQPLLTSAAIGTPVVSRMDIGNRLGLVQLNGHIKKLVYYPKRLPNYQLQILTK